MTIAAVAVFCVLLLVLAFLLPRLSRARSAAGRRSPARRPRRPTRRPGKLGHWLSKPFRTSQKAINKSGSTGRKGRDKMPF